MPEDECWDIRAIEEMNSTPWRHIPNQNGHKIPAHASDHKAEEKEAMDEDDMALPPLDGEEPSEVMPEAEHTIKTRAFKVTKDGELLEAEIRNKGEEIWRETKTTKARKHKKSTTQFQKERQSQAMKDVKRTMELHKMISKQCRNMIRQNDIINNQLEMSPQRAQCANTPLQKGLDTLVTAQLKPNDVSKIYSPPRIARVAREFGLAEGWNLDFATIDEMGRNWDF